MTTFFEQLEKLAHNTEELPVVYWVERRPMCDECRNCEVAEAGDLCERCAREWNQKYRVMEMLGRLHSGAERGHGVKYHAVAFDTNRAMCGAKPGPRSVGWSDYHGDVVTCPRCAARLERVAIRARENAAIMK